jgi:hypothetical protein
METIPFHIQEIAKLYPVVAGMDHNYADGRIDNWAILFLHTNQELPKPGGYISIHSKVSLPKKMLDFGEVWVHLSNGYFKQVIKKKLK